MKKLMTAGYSETSLSISLFVLRAASGAIMIPHGYNKMKNFSEYASGFTDPFQIGGSLSLSLCIFAELFCAILVVWGLFTRLASIPLIVTMSVVILIVFHGQISGKAELPALYLAVFTAMLFAGPGKFSLDKMIGK
jgi:putative oxidoreductase